MITQHFHAGGACPTPVELCEGQSCPVDMQCVRSGPTAPSVCQCLPERLDQCAGAVISSSLYLGSNSNVTKNFKSDLLVTDQTSLSFSGNSYIKYRVSDGGQNGEMKLSLRIRTLQRRGVIMYTRVNPCTMLKVGTVQVSNSVTASWLKLTSGPFSCSDRRGSALVSAGL